MHAKTSADTVKLLGNQTITGKKTFTGTISASNIIITNVGNPVNAHDAATKAYVGTLFNSLKSMGIVTDMDMNVYPVVKIGTQFWIREKNDITISEIATITELSEKGVEYHINRLKHGNFIERVGSDKGGHWQIKVNN